jgi:hypothetical protein
MYLLSGNGEAGDKLVLLDGSQQCYKELFLKQPAGKNGCTRRLFACFGPDLTAGDATAAAAVDSGLSTAGGGGVTWVDLTAGGAAAASSSDLLPSSPQLSQTATASEGGSGVELATASPSQPCLSESEEDGCTDRLGDDSSGAGGNSGGSEQLTAPLLSQPANAVLPPSSSSGASQPPTTPVEQSIDERVRAAQELVAELDKQIESKSLELSSIHMTFVVSDPRYLKLLEEKTKWAFVPYLLGTYNAYKSACSDSLAWLIFHLKAAENHKMKLLKDLRNRQQTHSGAASILWQVAAMDADGTAVENRSLIMPQLQLGTMSRNWIAAVSDNMLQHYSQFMDDWQSGHPRAGITSVDHTGKLLARAGKLTGGSNPLKWAWGQRDGHGLVYTLVFTRTQGYRDESLMEATAADGKIRREFSLAGSKVIYVGKPSDIRLIREVMFRGGGLEEYAHSGKIVYGCVGGSSTANGDEYDGYVVRTLEEAAQLLCDGIYVTESPRRAGLG